jgi:Ca2+-binding RTX toxin-like protein
VNKLSAVYGTICPLLIAAGCSSGGGGPELPDPDGDFEGIEEATQGLTDLSAQCTFVAGTGFATLALHDNDVALVNKLSSGALGVNGFPCAAATVTTLKKLIVTGTSGPQTVILDYLGGVFAPGITANVGVDVDLLGGTDALKIRGTKTADTFVFGSNAGALGIAINTDMIKDITVANVEQFVVTMSDGDDNFSGAGNAVVGVTAFPTAVTVYGGAGNDTIRGGAGDDTLNGGDGNDTFVTGATADGADTYVGGMGADTMDYGLRTGAVTVTLDGTANDGATGELDNVSTDIETLKGGMGNDILTGSAAADTIFGGPGDDTITGGDGNDTLNGDAGNDTFDEGMATNGADVINGGAGTDTVSYASRTNAVTVLIDAVAHSGETGENDKIALDVENVTGGAGNDMITGSAADNVLDGGAGNDTILGGLGNDTLRGGAGDDVLKGEAGDDIFDEGSAPNGADTMIGGAGIDRVDYSARTGDLTVVMDMPLTGSGGTPSGETITAVSEGDLISVDTENLIGGAGDDALTGNALDNQIEGGAGVDTINGLAGDDLIDGGAGLDVIDCGLGDADILLDLTLGSQTGCEL